jgi:hypothetical protein
MASTLCGVLTVVLILILLRELRGTTLTAALWWAAIAVAAIATVEFVDVDGSTFFTTGSKMTLRYVAAITTFCPMMAVLGAKRPQHGAWQLIVLSLWCVLALPAAESYFVRRGAAVQIHDARGWFLWILLVTGCLNYLGTRHGLAVLLAAIGQLILLGEHLPVWRRPVTSAGVAAAMTLFLGAALLVWIRCENRFGLRRQRNLPANPNDAWTAFRNLFGTFWALRIMERFNAQARLNHWSVELGYYGLRPAAATAGNLAGEPRQFLRSLLSRFVAKDWLEPDADNFDKRSVDSARAKS